MSQINNSYRHQEKVKKFGKRKLEVFKKPTYKGQPKGYFGVIISK